MKNIRAILPWVILAVYWPTLFVVTHLPKLPSVEVPGSDKTLHFAAYLLLTLTFWLARYGKARPDPRRFRAYLVLIIMAVYAALDELTQGLVPNRYSDPYDWLADVLGVLVALGFLYIVRRRRTD